MKKLAIIILLSSITAAAQAAPGTSQQPSVPAASSAQTAAAQSVNADPIAQKARALIEKMIAALGGQAYLTYTTKTEQGRTYSFFQGQPNSVGTPFWRFFKFPDKDRTELTKQRDVAYVINGNNGYEITYKGTATQEKDQLEDYLRRRAHSIDIVLRDWLKQPGTMLFYEGTATAEQKVAEKITILSPQNDSVTIFIDANTFLPIKRTFTYRDPIDKLKSTDDEIYGNYRAVQGIVTPHTIARAKNDQLTNQRFLNEVQYNVPVADSLFDAKATYDPWKRSGPRK